MFWEMFTLWNVRGNAFTFLNICSFFMENTHSLSIGTRAYFLSLWQSSWEEHIERGMVCVVCFACSIASGPCWGSVYREWRSQKGREKKRTGEDKIPLKSHPKDQIPSRRSHFLIIYPAVNLVHSPVAGCSTIVWGPSHHHRNLGMFATNTITIST